MSNLYFLTALEERFDSFFDFLLDIFLFLVDMEILNLLFDFMDKLGFVCIGMSWSMADVSISLTDIFEAELWNKVEKSIILNLDT